MYMLVLRSGPAGGGNPPPGVIKTALKTTYLWWPDLGELPANAKGRSVGRGEGSRKGAPEVEFGKLPGAGGGRGDSWSPREGAIRNTGRERCLAQCHAPRVRLGGFPSTESHACGSIHTLPALHSQNCFFSICTF